MNSLPFTSKIYAWQHFFFPIASENFLEALADSSIRFRRDIDQKRHLGLFRPTHPFSLTTFLCLRTGWVSLSFWRGWPSWYSRLSTWFPSWWFSSRGIPSPCLFWTVVCAGNPVLSAWLCCIWGFLNPELSPFWFLRVSVSDFVAPSSNCIPMLRSSSASFSSRASLQGWVAPSCFYVCRHYCLWIQA